MGNLTEKVYLTDSRRNESVTISKGITLGYYISWFRAGHQEMDSRGNMDTRSCRSITANQELQTARSMYETRTKTKNKQRIADMEASVKEEEGPRTEEDIAREVDWVQDLGTASKQATQFVRTQAESWRIETLLIRTLDSREEEKQHSQRDNFISEAQLKSLYEIYEALDLTILAVHDVVESVNKKLTFLIKLLWQMLSPDPSISDGQQQAPPKEIHNYWSLHERVDKNVLEQGLDTASRFEMPPQ